MLIGIISVGIVGATVMNNDSSMKEETFENMIGGTRCPGQQAEQDARLHENEQTPGLQSNEQAASQLSNEQEAILLKREVPTRSVNQIILILEGEGKVKSGLLKRSTLQEHLYKAGFGRRQMSKVAEARKGSSRRFCRPHRMMLAQADYPEFLLIPSFINGCLKQCA